MNKSKGFTLIELLVVVAIIGLLASIITFSVSTSRMRARDTRRITDMKQVKTGLDLYFTSGGGYPAKATWDANIGASLLCNGEMMLTVPHDPISPTYDYTYSQTGAVISGCGGTVGRGYDLQFYIESRGQYYIMDEDGNLRDAVTGSPASFDSLL